MAPGLALFYGGMVRSKGVLNMIMMVFGALAVVSITWVVVGYSLAFGDDVGGGLLGDPSQHFMFQDMLDDVPDVLPDSLFAIFQGLFGVVTVGLIAGAIADRTRFGTWLVFCAIWTVVVYAPIAHWAFDLSPRTTSAAGWRTGWAHSTSREAPRSRSPPEPPGSPVPWCSDRGSGFGRDAHAAAQPHAGHARRRSPLVRLVRFQRRVRPRRQPRRRGVREHP